MAITKIPASGFTGNNFKNIIINGDMSIAQRGTSSSSVTSSAYRTVDRWYHNVTTMGTWTLSQSTDVPSGQGFAKSAKWDCTTADASPSGDDRIMFQQYIEGQNLQYLKKGTANAESLTASFWVKSNKTGTYIVEIRDMDNSRTISKSYTIDASNTWEKKTITFAGDTSGALDNDNAGSIRFNFWLGSGSTYTSGTLATSWQTYSDPDRAVGQVNLADSTANDFYITGVQLEAGTTASDFEFLPYDVNLRRCQRYFQTYPLDGDQDYPICNMANWNGSTYYGKFDFIVPFRTAPSWTRTAGGHRLYTSNSNALISSASLEKVDMTSTNIVANPSSTIGSAGEAGFFWSENGAKNEFSAEL